MGTTKPVTWSLLVGGCLVGLIALVGLLVLILGPRPTQEPFYGEHQAGISTPGQKFAFVAAFDLTATKADEVRSLFQVWTKAASSLAQGLPLPGNSDPSVPTGDTGETLGYKPSRLTFTFGVGPSLFDGRFGLAGKRPRALNPLPGFRGDKLNPLWSDGDLVVQVGADDFQTAYHALHNLTRLAKGVAVPRWVQAGFQPGLEVNAQWPGRNLQGFLDGTVNPDVTKPEVMNAVVWVDQGPAWMKAGTYLVVRRIRMFVETWDRSSLSDQEQVIGRDKAKGLPLATQAEDSHVKLAHGTGAEKILRRPFSYLNGLDARTGQWDSGLLFLAWMKDPAQQFVPIQTRLSSSDALNEYIQPVGSAVFAVFPGVRDGDFIGSGLFPLPTLTQRIQGLQASIGALYSAAGRGDWSAVRSGVEAWTQEWNTEKTAAGDRAPVIDAARRAWEAAVAAKNPDPEVVRKAQADLTRTLIAWEESARPKADLTSAVERLKAALALTTQTFAKNDNEGAQRAFATFQGEWAASEALVRNLNSGVYSQIELLTGQARRVLQGTSDEHLGSAALRSMVQALDLLAPPTAYSAWDAGIILFREGLEALLVLAALLAFLGRTGQASTKPCIWSGAAIGLVASMGIAVVVSVTMQSLASGATPELVEGLAGLGAVVLMLTVGAWLHGKSAVKDWNLWLKERMNKAGNRPWALGALALLAVLREGAETVVFFWGMAGVLPIAELLVGIVGGLVVLAVVGVVLIGFSKRLPLQVFFPLATSLIYYLAVKVLGQSLASLQSVGWIPATPLGFGGSVAWVGFSPTWETALPQLVLGAVLGTVTALSLRKKRSA